MFDQTIIRICLIVGSLFTAGFILRRVRLAKQFFMSIRLSQLDSKVRMLTEQVALNQEKVERDKLDL